MFYFFIHMSKLILQLNLFQYYFVNYFQRYIQMNTILKASSKNEEDNNFNYYHEYCRLYLANVVLTSQMRQIMNERGELMIKMNKLQKKTEEIQQGGSNDEDRKKRFRRTANQIDRHYRCIVETCQKSYGSQGSLNQHIKLKHFELYQTMPHLSCTENGQYSQQITESIQIKKRKN